MNYTLLQGDVIEQLKTLPSNSVQACVTSPPYWGLRNYGHDGQIGLEETPQAYVAKMVAVFEEVRRVLRDDGCLWLNLGDSYFTDPGNGRGGGSTLSGARPHLSGSRRGKNDTLKPKDLCGIPWRVAFALQDAGWWLRSDIIWAKPNPMPESVKDRPTKAHEYIFLLTKSAKYYYDAEAIAEPNAISTILRDASSPGTHQGVGKGAKAQIARGDAGSVILEAGNGRNARSVWTIATQSYSEAHFATFPTEIPERCITASTSAHGCCDNCGAPWRRVVESTRLNRSELPDFDPRRRPRVYVGAYGEIYGRADAGYMTRETVGWQPTCSCNAEVVPCTVLDPFAGSGTTVAVAMNLGRMGIGIELNPEYIELAHRRILGTQPALIAV